MPTRRALKTSEPRPDGHPDWPHRVQRAAEAVLRRLRETGELSPVQVAHAAAATLPAQLRRWLLGRLAALGWLDPSARIPFDILDSPACPPDLRDGRRELVRVAVFGVAGEGSPSDAKRREALYQQRCAEILRETRDLESLSFAAARALGHPEVHADPVLFNLLRSFIAEREAEIRSRAHVPGADEPDARAAAPQVAEFKIPLRERVEMSLSRMRLELDSHIASYNEPGAQEVLVRIRDLRHRYPGHVEPATVQRCEQQVQELTTKRDLFRQQLNDLVQQATEAISRGDQKNAAWVLRRLSAIHTLLPAVLPEPRLSALRETVLQFSERHERHETARRLVVREQKIGARIKRLRAAIHEYHERMRQGSGDDTEWKRCTEEYRRAAAELRSCDDEWLADLMIELDVLLDEMHGDRQRAEAQVDSFVSNVRLALRQARQELREIEQQQAAAPDAG